MKKFIQNYINKKMLQEPDFIVGGHKHPYLMRWWLIPRNPIFNVYLHCFLRSDDDRALHDHPWINLSILVQGSYTEHEIHAGGIHTKTVRNSGDWKFRSSGRMAHRIELHAGACTTIFITGPVYRSWGFHCEKKGWVPWQQFVSSRDKGDVGQGCEP